MANTNLQIIIEAVDKSSKDMKAIQRELEKMDKSAKKTSKSFGMFNKSNKGFLSGLNNISTTLIGVNLGVVGLTLGVGALVRGMVKAAAEFEQTQISFEVMLGSAEQAKILLKDLGKFAATTPFQLTEVEQGAKQLLAFGVEARKIVPTLKSLGDVSAGLNVPMSRLILNFGQVKVQTKLTGRELRDFAVAGVPLLGELSKMLNVSEAAIFDMVSEGKIGFPEVEEAFRRMTSEGGRFANLMDKQSETFLGSVSNMKDSITLFLRTAGSPLLTVLKEMLDDLRNTALSFLDNEAAANAFGVKVAQLVQGLVVFTKAIMAAGAGMGFLGGSIYEFLKSFVTGDIDAAKKKIGEYKQIAVDAFNSAADAVAEFNKISNRVFEPTVLGELSGAAMKKAADSAEEATKEQKKFNDTLEDTVDKIIKIREQIKKEQDDFIQSQIQKSRTFEERLADMVSKHKEKWQEAVAKRNKIMQDRDDTLSGRERIDRISELEKTIKKEFEIIQPFLNRPDLERLSARSDVERLQEAHRRETLESQLEKDKEIQKLRNEEAKAPIEIKFDFTNSTFTEKNLMNRIKEELNKTLATAVVSQ